jgi:hypothetical protein
MKQFRVDVGGGPLVTIDCAPETIPPDAPTIHLARCANSALFRQQVFVDYYDLPRHETARACDLGCGVGAFLLTQAAEYDLDLPLEQVGVDDDATSLDFCRRNFAQNGLEPPQLHEESWFSEPLWDELGTFDVIFFNPPYLWSDQAIDDSDYEGVSSHATHDENPARHYQHVVPRARSLLRPGGMLVVRMSSSHKDAFWQMPDDVRLPGPEYGMYGTTGIRNKYNFTNYKNSLHFEYTRNIQDADGRYKGPSNVPRDVMYAGGVRLRPSTHSTVLTRTA